MYCPFILKFELFLIDMTSNEDDHDVLSLIIILLVIVTVNNARNRHRLTKSAMVHHCFSPWITLLRNADDGSFLTVTGFNRSAFTALEAVVFPEDRTATTVLAEKRGRPEILDNKGKLGLYLLYTTSRMEMKMLCLIFGIPPTTCIRYIDMMIKLVVKRLKKNAIARVFFPTTDEEKSYYASLIARREPAIQNCIGFVDGLSIPVQCCDEVIEQNKNYNGYRHDTHINNVLAFAPTGKIIYAALNYPGSWHDSQVAEGLVDIVIATIGAFCMWTKDFLEVESSSRNLLDRYRRKRRSS